MYAIEVDYIETNYNMYKIIGKRYYGWDRLGSGYPYFSKDISNPDIYWFKTLEEAEGFLFDRYDFDKCEFKIQYLNERIRSQPRIIENDIKVVKDYNNKNEYNEEGLKHMGIEIKANITATCDKCGKQEHIKEIEQNAAKLPDGWISISDQGIFCEECYKKYEEEQKKKDENVFNHIGNCITQRLKEIITESDEHTITLKDALEYIEFYGLRNLFNSQGDMYYVGMVACEVIDKAIENGEIMICKNALKHNE